MANKAPAIKVQKAKLYKMISYRGTGGGKKFTALSAADELSNIARDQDKAFKSITSGMNSLGASMNGIALQVEAMTQAMKDRVSAKIRGDNITKKQEIAADKAEADREKKKTNAERLREAKQKRADDEENSEKKKKKVEGEKMDAFKKAAKSAFGGFFGAIARFLGGIFKLFIAFAALDWISKNPEKVQKLAEGLAAVGKFIWNITSFLVGSSLDGLIKFMENPISLQGLLGFGQFLLSAAPIFLGIAFLKAPGATVKAVTWVVTSLVKGILNIGKAVKIGSKLKKFASSRFGKVAIAGGVGLSAYLGSKAAGDSQAEAIGAGVGTGGGALIGEAIGSKFGGPLGGMIGGVAGGFVGGKAGKAIGGFLEPIFEPIQKFFGMVGEVFNNVMAPIKESLGGFFEALGAVMTGILDFVEPHLPLISKILGVGIQVMFAPFFLGLKALTAVLKFFAPKTDEVDKEKSKSGKAKGGAFQTAKMVKPKMASGGTFNLQDEMAKQLQRTMKVAKAFGQLMQLPFKALGVGIMTAIGGIGKVFGAFLPAPIRNMLGSMVAPLAKIFGVPVSAIGGSAASSEEMKGEDAGKAKMDPAVTWEEKLLEAIAGDNGTISLFGKLFSAIVNHPIFKGVKAVAQGLLGGIKSFFGFAEGGMIPQAAMGGWISGPQSGYPVSLDGGATTAFIGHGTEWVGMKGFAGGGAFVVPFDTPATRKNPSLTSQRWGEAMRGGYSMPSFAVGGKFDTKAYMKGAQRTNHIKLGDNKYYVRYAYAGDPKDAKITVKSMEKQTKAGGLFGINEHTIGVEPGSDEFKAVMNSAGLKTDIAGRHKSKSDSRGRGAKPSNITEMKVHPKAMKFYEYDKTYRENRDAGMSKKDARNSAAEKHGTMTDADRKEAKKAAKDKDKNTTTKPETAQEKLDRLFGEDGMLAKGLGEMGKTIPTPTETTNTSGTKVENAQQNKTESKLDKLKAMTAQRDAGLQPNVIESQAAPIMGGGESEIIIPGKDKNDADEFLNAKFGLLNEFNSTYSNFM